MEKKHLELVPHEMSEQQFWSMFFQSHYFHRERCVTPNPADPFSDCVKADDRGKIFSFLYFIPHIQFVRLNWATVRRL